MPSVASDIYAFGAVLYELTTGKPPSFEASHAPQLPERPGFPKTWNTVVLKCPPGGGSISDNRRGSQGTRTPRSKSRAPVVH